MNHDPRPSLVGKAVIYTAMAGCILYIILQIIEFFKP